MEAANIRYQEPAVNWLGWRGVARTAVMALARLSDDRDVKRNHLKAAKKMFGSWIDFTSFARGGKDWAYEVNTSTRNDRNFNIKMEKHVNAVWKLVQKADAVAHTGADGFVNLGADIFAPPFVADAFNHPSKMIEFEDGDNTYAALFKDEYAYVATWDMASSRTPIKKPLLINRAEFRPAPYIDVETPEVIRGGSALDELLGASIANAVQDVLKAVRGRSKNMSIENAIARSLGYAGSDGLMWLRDNKSRKWLSRPWFDTAAALDPMLNKKLEGMRDNLRMEGLEDTRVFQRGYDRFNGHDRDERAATLLRLKRLTSRGLGLATRYRPFVAVAADLYGYPDGLAGAAVTDGLAVAAGAAGAAGAGEVVGPGGGVEAVAGVYEVVGPGGGADGVNDFEADGITVAGGNFGVRIGSKFDVLTGRISAAEAMIQTADASAHNQELQKIIAELHEGLLRAVIAFRSHVDGSLQKVAAEKWLKAPDLQLENTHEQLADIGSELAVLKGHVHYLGAGMTAEEPYIAERKLRYGFLSRNLEIGGRQVPTAMLRLKETGNTSKYVAFLLDMDFPRRWLHLDRRG